MSKLRDPTECAQKNGKEWLRIGLLKSYYSESTTLMAGQGAACMGVIVIESCQ